MLGWCRFDRRTVCMPHAFLCMAGRIECENSCMMHACLHAQAHMMLLSLLATAACATFEPGDHLKKNSMLDTLFLVSVLAQQCLDLIKDLVQVLSIIGMNAEYNLTPVEASGLHRQSNPQCLLLNPHNKKPRHFKWHQYTTRATVALFVRTPIFHTGKIKREQKL
jgi:hypothetical protein